jgi:hypothetical protein
MTLIPHTPHRRLDRTAKNSVYEVASECCGTCRFWQPDLDVTDGYGNPDPLTPDDVSVSFGGCRRRAPSIVDALVRVLITPPRYDEQLDAEMALNGTKTRDCSRFPGTYVTEWCGEFEWLSGAGPGGDP